MRQCAARSAGSWASEPSEASERDDFVLDAPVTISEIEYDVWHNQATDPI